MKGAEVVGLGPGERVAVGGQLLLDAGHALGVEAHFERVHPFIDGNGRAGRLVLNLVLVRLGHPLVVILKNGLAQWLRRWSVSYHDDTSGGTPYPDLAGPGADAPLPSYRLTVEQRDNLNERTGELTDLAAAWAAAPVLTTSVPRPTPQLRLVPDDGTATGLDATASPDRRPAE